MYGNLHLINWMARTNAVCPCLMIYKWYESYRRRGRPLFPAGGGWNGASEKTGIVGMVVKG